jgi:hypothetical protein
MEKSVYDTKEGITSMLGTFEGLHDLVKARREAGYERHESLGDFYILGRFHTDTCGNFVKYHPDYFPQEMYATLPKVLTSGEFSEINEEFGIDKTKWRQGNNMLLPTIPAPDQIDPLNGQGWTLETCHDAWPEESHETIDISDGVGKSLGVVTRALALRRDGIYRMWPSDGIRNDSYVDMTPSDETFGEPANPEGWRHGKEINDGYIVQPGDKIQVNVVRFYHGETYKIYRASEHKKELETIQEGLRQMLDLAGFTDIRVASGEIPQGRLSEWFGTQEASDQEVHEYFLHLPYLQVETKEGSFGILIGEEAVPFLDLVGTGTTARDLGKGIGLLSSGDGERLPMLIPLVNKDGKTARAFYRHLSRAAK